MVYVTRSVGEKMPTESEWAENPWLIPAVLMYGRLTYKFEGMTDMINGAFMDYGGPLRASQLDNGRSTQSQIFLRD
jgi:hypothetical protein